MMFKNKIKSALLSLTFVFCTLLSGQDTVKLSLVPSLIGDTMSLQLVADNFVGVDNFELSINYSDTDLLFSYPVLNGSLIQQSTVSDLGYIYFNWINPNAVPLTIPNQTVLAVFKFFVVQRNVQTCFDFNVNGRPPRFFGTLSTPIASIGNGICSHLFGGLVEGQLRVDVDNDCNPGVSEPPLAGKMIKFKAVGKEYLAITKEDGSFSRYLPFDNYSLVIPESDYFKSCTFNASVILQTQSFIQNLSAGVSSKLDCPLLNVDFNAAFINWCSSEIATLKYFNSGSKSVDQVYIELSLDPNLSLLQSSSPYTDLGNNQYRFDLGTVMLQSGNQIQLLLKSSCNASMQGRSVQNIAKIYPQLNCITSPLYSGADLEIKGSCINNENVFEVKNIGSADMKSDLVFNTVEDDIMPTFAGKIKLNKGTSELIKFPGNGKTRIIISDSIPNHPYQVRASAGIEGCGNGPVSKGFINNFAQGDQSPFVSRYTSELLSNNNQVLAIASLPEGASSQKYIQKDDRIYYTIRFRNKENKTVHRVVIRNEIPLSLDLSTLELARKDVHFEWSIVDNRILEVVFQDLNLPPDIDDEKASQVWFTYSIKPNPEVELNTRIENNASVIIDSRKIQQSSVVWHTIGNFIFTVVSDQSTKGSPINVYPNPFSSQIQFKLDKSSSYHLLVYSNIGQLLENKYFSQAIYNCESLAEAPIGNYYYVLFDEGKVIASGKIIKSEQK